MTEPLLNPGFMRKLENLTLLSRKVFSGQMRGERRSTEKGSSVEFADYRNYSQGDDLRHLDWNALARFDDMIMRMFIDEQDLNVYILIDSSGSMEFGTPNKMTYARKIAAALSYMALSNLDRVTLHGWNEDEYRLSPQRGRGAIFGIGEFLQNCHATGKGCLNAHVDRFVSRRPRPGVVYLITDLMEPEGYEDALRRLRYTHYDPVVIHVLAPEEVEPTLGGDFRLVDSETGEPIEISMNRRTVQAYTDRLRGFLDGAEQFCRRHRVGYLRALTSIPFEDLMIKHLREAALAY